MPLIAPEDRERAMVEDGEVFGSSERDREYEASEESEWQAEQKLAQPCEQLQGVHDRQRCVEHDNEGG